MRIKEFFATAAAFALTAGSALAQAAQPVTAPLEGSSSMGGGSTLLIIALVVALGIGVYFITKNDNNPSSP